MFKNKPVILICGDGGSGKDMVSKHISDNWFVPYKHSTSYAAAQRMWPQVQKGDTQFAPGFFKDFQEFYNQRSRFRRFWADWIDRYNASSESKVQLYIDLLESGNNILNGIRRLHELSSVRNLGIVDLVMWIQRPGIPRDPTQEFGPEACDVTIINDEERKLWDRLQRLRALSYVLYCDK